LWKDLDTEFITSQCETTTGECSGGELEVRWGGGVVVVVLVVFLFCACGFCVGLLLCLGVFVSVFVFCFFGVPKMLTYDKTLSVRGTTIVGFEE
jgi:hypothetical protein